MAKLNQITQFLLCSYKTLYFKTIW